MRSTVSEGWTVTVFGTTARYISPAGPVVRTGISQATAVSDTTISASFRSARRHDSLCMYGICLLLLFSVTAAAARVGETAPRDGDELPSVGTGRQRELQHTVGRAVEQLAVRQRDRKSTRLNSSHLVISYAVFCLKKKKKKTKEYDYFKQYSK